MEHQFQEYGSLADQCVNCNTPFSYAVKVDRYDWAGTPCQSAYYTPSESFAIERAWNRAIDLWAARELGNSDAYASDYTLGHLGSLAGVIIA